MNQAVCEDHDVGDIIEEYGCRPDSLIAVLQDIQAKLRYLPEESLRQVSARLGVPIGQVYTVATFYKAFSLTPCGEHIIQVCMGTACHVRGAQRLLEELERQLEIRSGETTEDGVFTLEAVNCLGACALAPVMLVDETYHDHMAPGKLRKLIESVRGEGNSDNAEA
ncbi:NADH-quinone oxidoreductase subunit NuoE [Candidatus Hydrogenedentota bacterium]